MDVKRKNLMYFLNDQQGIGLEEETLPSLYLRPCLAWTNDVRYPDELILHVHVDGRTCTRRVFLCAFQLNPDFLHGPIDDFFLF